MCRVPHLPGFASLVPSPGRFLLLQVPLVSYTSSRSSPSNTRTKRPAGLLVIFSAWDLLSPLQSRSCSPSPRSLQGDGYPARDQPLLTFQSEPHQLLSRFVFNSGAVRRWVRRGRRPTGTHAEALQLQEPAHRAPLCHQSGAYKASSSPGSGGRRFTTRDCWRCSVSV